MPCGQKTKTSKKKKKRNLKKKIKKDFPGGPVVKIPRFQCRGRGFDSLVGEPRSHMPRGAAEKKKTNKGGL